MYRSTPGGNETPAAPNSLPSIGATPSDGADSASSASQGSSPADGSASIGKANGTSPGAAPSAGVAASGAAGEGATGSSGACAAPAWERSKEYRTKGIVISHNGRQWKSRWWTRGNEPGGRTAYGAWSDLGSC
ncbi:carbohydrate-binding protein [Streptomyces sp. M41]|uniref:carbohydrate-binding protein n=1 Tax=Streptomyces sp. M41 TaxID=3059412 RepID=UPI00374CB43D